MKSTLPELLLSAVLGVILGMLFLGSTLSDYVKVNKDKTVNYQDTTYKLIKLEID